MFVDARRIERSTTLGFDVCVIGAGPAGITLALELMGRGLRIGLLESGGLGFDAATQELAAGEVVGRDYFPLQAVRTRAFGGTSNQWAGHCIVPDASDFTERAWIPHSGWPFGRAELDPFYRHAARICQIDPDGFDPAADDAPLAFARDRVRSRVVVMSPPTRFHQEYAPAIRASSEVRALLFANVTDLQTDAEARSVRRAEVRCLGGNRLGVRARVFVLACGGIENARLLLASRGSMRDGLGNAHGLVGRYFMEHPVVWSGILLPSAPRDPLSFYDRHERRRGYLALAEETRRRERLLNAGMMILPLEEHTLYRPERASGDPVWEPLARTLPFLDRGEAGAARARVLWSFLEQAPDPESRVTLSDEVDALGQPRARLDWRLGELERHSIRRTHEIVAQELGLAGLGRLRVTVGEDEGWRIARGGHHHMGTTRMHADPQRGVVDADCRVHGVSNLYVAGSSVFPTVGCANPTLTLVALAARLARHLRQKGLR